MLPSSTPQNDVSLMLIEGGLTLIALAVPFALPRIGNSWFLSVERAFGRLARRKAYAVAAVGAAALLLRLVILPFCPVPLPFVPNDFSFLLAANTFLLGRLTNPTPPMWIHFESIHITMQPTYTSMYFPSVGLVLAAGKLLFGNPWFGILCASALMCAALCWMLQAWLPPTWALLGGVLAILRLGLFSYWVNTYSAGGSIAALGGALVLGALPRLTRTPRLRYALLLAIGIVLLATTRPYEGLLLCLPVAVYLGRWLLFGKNRPSKAALLRLSALPLALILLAGAWMAYYDYRAFGSPATLPYTVDRATYAIAPYYVWQSARPEPAYHHQVMREFYVQSELSSFTKIHSLSGFLPQTLIKVVRSFEFYAGFALLLPLLMIRRVFLDRRIRFLVLCVFVLAAGMVVEIFLVPHYLAPFTAAFYAIGLQAMRHLRVWRPGGQPAGLAMVRLTVTACLILAGLRLFPGPLHLALPEWPVSASSDKWYGPDHFGTERARVEGALEQLPGRQLVIVRYSPRHNPLDEWVYNAPDIDSSKVVWAREMDAAHNSELMHYFANRKVWLVEPDSLPATVLPHPANQEAPDAPQ
ncbi:MAG TPA: hypothetical protein VMQ56_16500 [Terracidiphilus sp.]|jgi:hypothetical protein|nr:hypothetical protein [Terracidiphilus sp.]